MKHPRSVRWLGLILLLGALGALAACAPFGGANTPPPGSLVANATAVASATAAATGGAATPASLPQLHPDAGWVAEVEIADGSKFGGSGVMGGPAGGATASVTETLGYFTLADAALVTMVFSCQSVAGTQATLKVSVGDVVSGAIQCSVAGASTHDVAQLPSTLVGHSLPVNVTISTDGAAPQWNLLVEQPK